MLRKKIDRIDNKLIKLLMKRNEAVRVVGIYKKENNIPTLDKKRWNKVLKNRLESAKKLGLSEDFVEKVWNLIHKEALRIEGEV